MADQSKLIEVNDKKEVCQFCNLGQDSNEELGKLYKFGNNICHHFCLVSILQIFKHFFEVTKLYCLLLMIYQLNSLLHQI